MLQIMLLTSTLSLTILSTPVKGKGLLRTESKTGTLQLSKDDGLSAIEGIEELTDDIASFTVATNWKEKNTEYKVDQPTQSHINSAYCTNTNAPDVLKTKAFCSGMSYQNVQQCTTGNHYGTEYTASQTPTIEACVQKCKDTSGCQCFAYGNENAYDGLVSAGSLQGQTKTSDGYHAKHCKTNSNCLFQTGGESTCRFNVYTVWQPIICSEIGTVWYEGEESSTELGTGWTNGQAWTKAECFEICGFNGQPGMCRWFVDDGTCKIYVNAYQASRPSSVNNNKNFFAKCEVNDATPAPPSSR